MRQLQLVTLPLLIIVNDLLRESDSKDTVYLLAKGFEFKADFTYKIPSYMTLLDLTKTNNFKSPIFSTKYDQNLRYYFSLSPAVRVSLYVESLPPNVDTISGRVECGLIDVFGKKVHAAATNESIVSGSYFGAYDLISLSALESNSKELLPGGHLTIQCDVDCVMVHNLNATNGTVPSEEIQVFLVGSKVTNDSECGKEIAMDTLNRLSLFDDSIKADVELKSSRKSFQCHSAILRQRMTLFKFSATTTGEKSVYDLTSELNAEQLEDMVTFMYRGKAANLERNCRVLLKVGRKYGILCLVAVCEQVMIHQIKAGNSNCDV